MKVRNVAKWSRVNVLDVQSALSMGLGARWDWDWDGMIGVEGKGLLCIRDLLRKNDRGFERSLIGLALGRVRCLGKVS